MDKEGNQLLAQTGGRNSPSFARLCGTGPWHFPQSALRWRVIQKHRSCRLAPIRVIPNHTAVSAHRSTPNKGPHGALSQAVSPAIGSVPVVRIRQTLPTNAIAHPVESPI